MHPQFAEQLARLLHLQQARQPRCRTRSRRAGRRPWRSARGKLEGGALHDVKELFSGEWQAGSSGSRLAFRQRRIHLHDDRRAVRRRRAGSRQRLRQGAAAASDDGSVPADNPFAGRAGARPEVYSYGHRDQLGLVVHPNGAVLAAEQGPNGGDEINQILPGRNYGWPKYSFGRNYDGPRISAMPVGRRHRAAARAVVALDRAHGARGLYGRQVPGVARQPIHRQRADRRDPAHGRARARGVQRQARGAAPRARCSATCTSAFATCARGPDGLLYVITDEDDGALLRIEPAAL